MTFLSPAWLFGLLLVPVIWYLHRSGAILRSHPVENLELWQALLQVQSGHEVTWRWVRGHAGNAKNEYADHLAVRAASVQITSQAVEPTGFDEWLEARRAKGPLLDHDPDTDFETLAAQTES